MVASLSGETDCYTPDVQQAREQACNLHARQAESAAGMLRIRKFNQKKRTMMDLELKDKVVIVTGASEGIGLACASAFLKEGARVAIVGRRQSKLDVAKAELHAGEALLTIAADMGQAQAAADMADQVRAHFGEIDILVNSAGAAKRYAPETLTAQDWRDAMDAKYFTTINAIEAVIHKMVEQRKGVIVNVIGMGGKVASPLHMPGGAANAALMLATAGLAKAWGKHGVRVNAVNPGGTSTGRVLGRLQLEAQTTGKSIEELRRKAESAIPMQRYGQPEEVADAVLFLASSRASYVTGAILSMDGGLNALI